MADVFAIDVGANDAYDLSIACDTGRRCLLVEAYALAGAGSNWDIRGRLVGVQRAYLPLTLP